MEKSIFKHDIKVNGKKITGHIIVTMNGVPFIISGGMYDLACHEGSHLIEGYIEGKLVRTATPRTEQGVIEQCEKIKSEITNEIKTGYKSDKEFLKKMKQLGF